MFMTETAKQADIVFPAASAYEKDGTVTNTAGEIQLLHKAAEVMGARSDFDLLRILSHQLERADLGKAFHFKTPGAVFDEIRKVVPGYKVQPAGLLTGGAEPTKIEFAKYGFLIVPIVKVAILVFLVLTLDAYLTWLERKVIAHIQARWGPHRVGPHGLLQPLADGIKFILKEDPMPVGVDKKAYFFAPFLTLMLALTSLSVIPFGPDITIFGYTTNFGIADVNISLLVLFAITALGVYGIALAGWGSNNKYSLLGGLRSSAQMISYELALTLSVVGVLL